MQTTTNYGLKKPEGNEFVSIDDLNYNADKTDEALKDLEDKKLKASGGDIKDTVVSEFADSDTQWPVPAAGEEPKTLWGKVKKFIEDFKNWMTGVCLIGQIVNNCVTNNPNLPLSAAQGKVLMDLYTVLNTKAQWKYVGNSFQDVNLPANTYTEVFVGAFVGDDNSQMIPFLIPLLTTEYSPVSASGSHPRYVTVAGTNGGWVSIHYTKTLIRLQNSSAGKNDSGTNKSSIYVYAR